MYRRSLRDNRSSCPRRAGPDGCAPRALRSLRTCGPPRTARPRRRQSGLRCAGSRGRPHAAAPGAAPSRPGRYATQLRRGDHPGESLPGAAQPGLQVAAWGGCSALLKKGHTARREGRGVSTWCSRGLGYHVGRAREEKGCGSDWSLTISFIRYVQPMTPPEPSPPAAPAAPAPAPTPAAPPNHLPERIRMLADISQNRWWSWQLDARELFHRIDRRLWEGTRHNAVQFLRQVSVDRLAEHAQDPISLERYDRVVRRFELLTQKNGTWFAGRYPELLHRPIAYFSGGLGVLAGDHCKEASDLGVPLIGVGLYYHGGYFDQQIGLDGWQRDTDDH